MEAMGGTKKAKEEVEAGQGEWSRYTEEKESAPQLPVVGSGLDLDGGALVGYVERTGCLGT